MTEPQGDLFAKPEDDRVVMVYFAQSARLKSVHDGVAAADSIGGMQGARLERMGLRLVLGDYDALPSNPPRPPVTETRRET